MTISVGAYGIQYYGDAAPSKGLHHTHYLVRVLRTDTAAASLPSPFASQRDTAVVVKAQPYLQAITHSNLEFDNHHQIRILFNRTKYIKLFDIE